MISSIVRVLVSFCFLLLATTTTTTTILLNTIIPVTTAFSIIVNNNNVIHSPKVIMQQQQQRQSLYHNDIQPFLFNKNNIVNHQCHFQVLVPIKNRNILSLLSLLSMKNSDDSVESNYVYDVDECKEYGTRLIQDVVRNCGVTNPNDITIQWKGTTRIIVTIYNTTIGLLADNGIVLEEEEELVDDNDFDDDDDDEVEAFDEDYNVDVDDDDDDDYDDNDRDEMDTTMNDINVDNTEIKNNIIDISKVAKAINNALDDGIGNIGTYIAEQYEIEVTTPGVDELGGYLTSPIMYNAYKSFDVIVSVYGDTQDDYEKTKRTNNKKNKKKTDNDDDDDTMPNISTMIEEVSIELQQQQQQQQQEEVEEQEKSNSSSSTSNNKVGSTSSSRSKTTTTTTTTTTTKEIQGKLVERNEQYTIINVKGRIQKIDNTNVISVRLPKAKKEKK